MASLSLNEKTKVSIGLVFVVGAYVVSLEGRVQANTVRGAELTRVVELMTKIDRRLSRIEGALGVKVPKKENASDSE